MRSPLLSAALAVSSALVAAATGCGSGSSGSAGNNLIVSRYGHTATTLPDGRVVVIGGVQRADRGTTKSLRSEIEIFDPTTLTSQIVNASKFFARAFHAAAYSDAGTPSDPSDDYILIAGGIDGDPDNASALARNVVKIPLAGPQAFQPQQVADLPHETADQQAVTLGDGRVAFTCGRNSAGSALGEITIYSADASTRTIPTDLDQKVNGNPQRNARWNHRAVHVPTGVAGSIFITGGRDETSVANRAILYDVDANVVSESTMPGPKQMHTLTYLDNGTSGTTADDAIVETGGLDDVEETFDRACCAGGGSLSTVVVYQIRSGVVSASVAATLPRQVFFGAAAAANGGTAIVTAGGFTSIFVDFGGTYRAGDFIDSDPVRDGAILRWDAAGGTLGVQTFVMAIDRAMLAASALPDGRVALTGGINGDLNSDRGLELLGP